MPADLTEARAALREADNLAAAGCMHYPAARVHRDHLRAVLAEVDRLRRIESLARAYVAATTREPEADTTDEEIATMCDVETEAMEALRVALGVGDGE